MPGPTSTTTPAPSWPKITGKSPSGSPPERVNSSVWQTPDALISTSTSPNFGPSRSTSSISRFLPASKQTAALVFTRFPLEIRGRSLEQRRRHRLCRDVLCECTRHLGLRLAILLDQPPAELRRRRDVLDVPDTVA